MPSRLFVAGAANIDLTFRVPAPPRAGVTEVCPDYRQGFGGKGANQAVQAARLGASVTFLGKVGGDPFGPAVIRQLQSEGINAEHVSVEKDLLTGTAVILVEPSGQNSIITSAGPNVAVGVEDIRRASAAISSADALLATLELPGEPLLEAFRLARAGRVRTILNPAPPVIFPRELLALVDVCVPNESELLALTGLSVDSLDSAEKAAKELRRAGPEAVVVTLAERGCLVVDEGGSEQIPGARVTAVDTSGAGDAFTAVLGVALAEGRSLREAARWANAVAALSITRHGTQASFPRRDEIER
jgi:ribokinase